MKKENDEMTLDDAYSFAHDMLIDIPPPEALRPIDFCNESEEAKQAMTNGKGRANYVFKATKCLVDYHKLLSKDIQTWNEGDCNNIPHIKKWLKRTKQPRIVLENRLWRTLQKHQELTMAELNAELLWLQSLFWDGGFAYLLFIHNEFYHPS